MIGICSFCILNNNGICKKGYKVRVKPNCNDFNPKARVN